MAWLDRFRRGSRTRMRGPARDAARTGSTTVRASSRVDEEHLLNFVTARRGVEGFVEPRTAVSDVTLLLVAHDGEWTRRRVPSVDWAHKFCNNNHVPSYDAAVVGIPQRMRDYNRRKKLRGDLSGVSSCSRKPTDLTSHRSVRSACWERPEVTGRLVCGDRK